jgi:hypothetical protein
MRFTWMTPEEVFWHVVIGIAIVLFLLALRHPK